MISEFVCVWLTFSSLVSIFSLVFRSEWPLVKYRVSARIGNWSSSCWHSLWSSWLSAARVGRSDMVKEWIGDVRGKFRKPWVRTLWKQEGCLGLLRWASDLWWRRGLLFECVLCHLSYLIHNYLLHKEIIALLEVVKIV